MKNKFFITLFACLLPWMAGAQQTISKQNNVAEKDYIAYLFTYFTGNHISEEAVCYAVIANKTTTTPIAMDLCHNIKERNCRNNRYILLSYKFSLAFFGFTFNE